MTNPSPNISRLSVAPMMDWTTRHCRYFHRLLHPTALLYTEMVTTGALIHGDRARHLDFDAAEHPIALQLGGSDPHDLATCTRMAAEWGYDEVNLNCGCPSPRVQKGAFGACLMNEPALVAECVAAMKAAAPALPITIKCRIGVDDCDDEPFLEQFISTVKSSGCNTFIIHARKAWLQGLSPKENREIPPLRYDVVDRLKARHPDLTIILNGGVKTIEEVQKILGDYTSPLAGEGGAHAQHGRVRGNSFGTTETPMVFTETLTPHPPTLLRRASPSLSPTGRGIFDGVMIGRAAYENPYILAELAHALDGTPLPDRADIARQMMDYVRARRATDPTLPLNTVTRHMLGLYHGQRGGRIWRRILTEGAQQPGADELVIEDALAAL